MESAQTFTQKYVQAPGFFKKTLFTLFSLAVLIFVFQWISSPMIVTVTGSGEVSAPAESATITFTVTGNSDNTTGAINSAKEKVSKIKESLKTLGISESDIYESQIATYPASAVTQGASGFTATSTMGVKTVQINNLDGMISSLYGQGATLVSQPVLTIDETDKLESEAFNMAVKDAKSKGSSIAFKNLKFIRKIVLIEQASSSPSSTVTSKADTVTQIEQNISPDTGIIKIQKSVSVSYKMW